MNFTLQYKPILAARLPMQTGKAEAMAEVLP
ncbi:MAG: hypothetical protein ACI956_002742 [Nonlabens sp.]